MPTFHFSSKRDAQYFRRRSAEKIRLYCKPRRWLVNNQNVTLNIYGETGTPITGTDGATSASAVRQFTSAAIDFAAAGVLPTDIVEIFVEVDDGENGRFVVESVISAHVLLVDRNWTVGNKTGRKFKVHFADERYVEFKQLVSFVVKLDPPSDDLTKWGIEEKRDALVILSIELCNDMNLVPKIGDRFVYEYEDRNIHYEMKEIKLMDQLGDSGVPLHYVGGAMKTEDRLPHNV